MKIFNIQYFEDLTSFDHCPNCHYSVYSQNWGCYCSVFKAMGSEDYSYNFCPLTGEMTNKWKLYAIWGDMKYRINEILRVSNCRVIYENRPCQGEALCLLEDKTSAWVPFDHIKNEEEI